MRKILITLAVLLVYAGSATAAVTTTFTEIGTLSAADVPVSADVDVAEGDVVVLLAATNKNNNVPVSFSASNATLNSALTAVDANTVTGANRFNTWSAWAVVPANVSGTVTFTAAKPDGSGITANVGLYLIRADSGQMTGALAWQANEWGGLLPGETLTPTDALSWSADASYGEVAVVGAGSSQRGNLTVLNTAIDVDIDGGPSKRLIGHKSPLSAGTTSYNVTWTITNADATNNDQGTTLSMAFAEIMAATPQYTVGGTVSGLGGELKLTNNGADEITVTSDGPFTFPTALDDGSAYAVAITQTPATQSCTLTNGSGTLSGANVTNVTVTCADVPTYTVGGTVSGLNGTLVLQNNGGDDETITADGPFAFDTALLENDTYNVTILTEPTTQTCTVTGGSGTVGTADVTSVTVTCANAVKYAVNVDLSGLAAGESVTLQNNGADNLVLSADGTAAFANTLEDGASYAVTVSAQPASQECTVTNGSGTIASADVTVPVACVDVPTYAIGGTVSGLTGDVTLQLNGGSDLVLGADGTFVFTDELKAGETYSVTVSASPADQSCTVVSGGTGTVGSSDVTDVVVECVEDSGPPPSYDPVASDVPTLSRWGLLVLVLTLGLVAFTQRRHF